MEAFTFTIVLKITYRMKAALPAAFFYFCRFQVEKFDQISTDCALKCDFYLSLCGYLTKRTF